MSASLPPQVLASTTDSPLSVEKSLGEVKNSISEVKLHSFDFPAKVFIVKTCGDGAIAGLLDGKVVLVTVSPTLLIICWSVKSLTLDECVILQFLRTISWRLVGR